MRRRRRPDRWTETPSCSEFRTSDWREWWSGSRALDSRMFGRTKAVRLTRYPEWRGGLTEAAVEAKPRWRGAEQVRRGMAAGGTAEGGLPLTRSARARKRTKGEADEAT